MDATIIDRYLARIGVRSRPPVTYGGLASLQLAHLRSVPFENVHVVAGRPMSTDPQRSIEKIVEERRGGWCFELNGAFAELLEALGFGVYRIGAAVLLNGPTDAIDHVALEVTVDQPYLVDVGFGESFTQPLKLNDQSPQPGGSGIADFQILPSWKGHTLVRLGPGAPQPQYRFSRVVREMADFVPASDRLRSDPGLDWSNKVFATRLIDDGPQRVTLLSDRLKIHGPGGSSGGGSQDREAAVSVEAWPAALATWFDLHEDRHPNPAANPSPWAIHHELDASDDVTVAVQQIERIAAGESDSADHPLHGDQQRVLELISQHDDIALRTCRPGHLTGSALVLNPHTRHILLLFHTKLQKWLQPGGHADGDTNLARVALREAQEETGIGGLRVVTPAIDIDIHQVDPPAEDAHLHLDVRFLVLAPADAVAEGNHESQAIVWVSLDELESKAVDPGVRRLALRALKVCDELEESSNCED